MLSKSSFFTTILLLLPAMASAQTSDDDLQLELRYYARLGQNHPLKLKKDWNLSFFSNSSPFYFA